MNKFVCSLASLASVCVAAAPQAVTVPYTENYAANNANWQNNASGLLTYVASGGPDGSSYASGPYNFQNALEGGASVLFRANTAVPGGPASGGNFHGNWIADDANKFSAYVRHNATEPLSFFARFADPAGFPAVIFSDANVVAPNTWTQIEFLTYPGNPDIDDEGFPFSAVMDSIGRVQIGAFASATLAGVNQVFTFDIDQVHVDVPEPSSVLLGSLAVVAIGCGRRRFR